MSYEILNPRTVVNFIKNIPEMKKKFSDFSGLEVEEIGDGNVNFVYRIKDSKSDSSVILKQAVPYLRVAGESFPLSRERMNFEVMALEGARQHSPKFVPEVYYSCLDQSLMIMEDLNNHKIVRGEIIQGKTFPFFSEHISSYLANSLFFTSDLCLSSEEKKEQVRKFTNSDLCKLTEDLVFTHPFERNETNSYNVELSQEVIDKIQKGRDVKIAVNQMRYKFMTCTQALLHGDFHIGSIMANEKETYVIDPEFSFYGPMGFDLGAIIGNLYISYFSHSYEMNISGEQTRCYRKWLLNTIEEIWIKFEEKFKKLWIEHEVKSESLQWKYENGLDDFRGYVDTFMNELFADMIGFSACKMMRRVVGLAKVDDFTSIVDLKARAEVEKDIINMASNIIVNRKNFSNINKLTELAKMISPIKG